MDDDLRARCARSSPSRSPWTGPTTRTSVLIRLQLPDGVLHVEAPRKRLYTGTIYLFVALARRHRRCCCSASPRCSCAIRCGRSGGWPARPRRSAWAATSAPIKPEGATEVRQAAAAFNRMQERVRALPGAADRDAGRRLPRPAHAADTAAPGAGDAAADEELRQDVAEMTADVAEMERMIGGYLAFARGEGTEQAEPVNLCGGAGGGRRRRAPRRRRARPRRAAGPDIAAARQRRATRDHQPGRQCASPCARTSRWRRCAQGRIGAGDGGR